MPNKQNAEQHESLSEEQRLTLLERTVTTNKFVLIGLALLLIISISVALTTTIVTSMREDEVRVDPKAFIALQQEVIALKQQISLQQASNETLQREQAKLKTAAANSSAPGFQKVMLQQEASIQEFLKSLKTGMYDLARMVPGSRTWLDLYNEQMNQAIAQSEARTRELKRLHTATAQVEP